MDGLRWKKTQKSIKLRKIHAKFFNFFGNLVMARSEAGRSNLNEVLLELSCIHSFTYHLWVFSTYSGRVAELWQQVCSLHVLEYLLSGPLQEVCCAPVYVMVLHPWVCLPQLVLSVYSATYGEFGEPKLESVAVYAKEIPESSFTIGV
jgi:hypothetical protein